LELRDGDRVVFLGDTLVERGQSYGWIELMLTARAADRTVTFRNRGWSADTPSAVPATAVESATPAPFLFKIARNPRHRPLAPNRDLNQQAMSARCRA
jgi:hypothetical protein